MLKVFRFNFAVVPPVTMTAPDTRANETAHGCTAKRTPQPVLWRNLNALFHRYTS
jgi:hypothetical protein